MSYELAKKLRNLDAYDPIEGDYMVRLDANESCFNINDKIGDLIGDAVKQTALNRYPDSLAENVSRVFAGFYGIPADYVTAGNGSDELISVITSTFLEKGDTVLTLSPDFSMYAFYGNMYELKVRNIQKNEDLTIDVQKVIDTCNNCDVKAVIFSNPCNPTSLGLTRREIERLVKNVFCLVIIDEAYMDFWSESVIDLVDEYDNLIVLKTCSKAMGLAALRLGFAVAGPTITHALRAVKSPYNVNAVTQAAAAAVMKQKPLIMENTAEIIHSRKFLQSEISALAKKYDIIDKVYDSVTNFVFVKTSAAKRIHEDLLKRSVAVRGMGNNYLRITAGTEEENACFLSCFEEILEQLSKETADERMI
ncbi:MAG: pyridoxal phosphate-dependent aminotransferase [Huintestinicola sp.]